MDGLIKQFGTPWLEAGVTLKRHVRGIFSPTKSSLISFNKARHRLTGEEMERMRGLWKTQVEAKGKKRMEYDLFYRLVLRASNVPTNLARRMETAMRRLVKGGGGAVQGEPAMTFQVFVSHVAVFLRGSETERLKLVTRMYDRSAPPKRHISTEDVLALLEADTLIRSADTCETISVECFEGFDKDKDGKLGYSEFAAWVRKVGCERTHLLQWAMENREKRGAEAESGPSERSDLIDSSVRRAELAKVAGQEEACMGVSGRELQCLNRAYERMKWACGNKADKAALASVFTPPLPDELLARMFALFDDNVDGRLSQAEFANGFALLFSNNEATRTHAWFHLFDRDGSGMLTETRVTAMRQVMAEWLQNDEKEGEAVNEAEEDIFAMDVDQFASWIQSDHLPVRFLERMRQVANTCLGIRPFAHEEEHLMREMMDDMEAAGPQLGEKRYLVSKAWWDKWEAYANEAKEKGEKQALAVIPPCAVVNRGLLVKKKVDTLKQGVEEGRDFVLVSSPVWHSLRQWYGADITISRSYCQQVGGRELFLELHPMALKGYLQVTSELTGITEANRRLVRISGAATPDELQEELCHVFRVADASRSRVWKCSPAKKLTALPTSLAPAEDDLAAGERVEGATGKSLQEYGVAEGDAILLEYRREGEGWPLGAVNQRTKKEKRAGVVGLQNLGNTCFMNSAVQCLSQTAPLTDYFLDACYKGDVNKRNQIGYQGDVAKAYAGLLMQLWRRRNPTASVPPQQLRRVIAAHARSTTHRSLSWLLDGIHEDLNRVKDKEYVEYPGEEEAALLDDSSLAALYWECHLKRNQSIIVDLFQGQMMSTLTCQTCEKQSKKFEPFTALQLPLPLDLDAYFTVTFHRLGASEVPVEYGIVMPREGTTARSLKDKISALVGLPPASFVLCLISRGAVSEFIGAKRKVKKILSSRVHAFQLYAQARQAFEEDADNWTKTASSDAVTDSSVTDMGVEVSSVTPTGEEKKEEKKEELEEEMEHHGSPMGEVLSALPSASASAAVSVSATQSGSTTSVCAGVLRFLKFNPYYVFVPYEVVVAGMPLVLPLPRRGKRSVSAIYSLIGERLGACLRMDDAQAALRASEDLDDAAAARRLWPFVVKHTSASAQRCSLCSWASGCLGCELLPSNVDLITNKAALAVEWDKETMAARYDSARAKLTTAHESVAEMIALQNQPLALSTCLEMFAAPEFLSRDEAWYCSACDGFQPAIKQLQVWRLPPVLIIHLKRFRFNGKHLTKINKLVTFPLDELHIASAAAAAQESLSEAEKQLVHSHYRLFAVLDHFGTLTSGHYVSYATALDPNAPSVKDDAAWYEFNDSSCREVPSSKVVNKAAYVLFYASRDLSDVDLRSGVLKASKSRCFIM